MTHGHNNPPAFDAWSLQIDTLFEQANGITAIETAEQEAQAAALLDELRQTHKDADKARADEKRPHDDAAKAVQAKWKPILGKADIAIAAVKAALTPYREAEQARQAKAAQEARERAEALAAQAQAAMQSDDLDDRVKADDLADAAVRAVRKANAIDRQATGLRTIWEAEVTDRRAALHHYIKASPEAFEALIQQLADSDARNAATRRDIPGVIFHERKRAA